eukprot:12242150-Heterocapsa_arctica.AAC.2
MAASASTRTMLRAKPHSTSVRLNANSTVSGILTSSGRSGRAHNTPPSGCLTLACLTFSTARSRSVLESNFTHRIPLNSPL